MNSNITFELRRPFGGAVVTSNNPGTLHNHFTSAGRGAAGDIGYTHILDVPDSFDIRDGCLRGINTSSLAYGDGDEIRIPDSSGTIYVVVYVERVIAPPGTPAIKRAYLLRDTAVWPGP